MKNCCLCNREEIKFYPTYKASFCPKCDKDVLVKVTYNYIERELNNYQVWLKSKPLGILSSIAEYKEPLK